MFLVTGELDGAVYQVRVTGDAADPVVGSGRVRALVSQYEGRRVPLSPVGPTIVVDGGDEATVLALLSAKTRVRRVGPGAPDPVPVRRCR